MQKVKEKSNWKGETIVEIEIERLKAFRNHSFQVRDDDDLEKLKESIKMYGILTPLLVRPIKDGTYEIISGHRRKRAAALLGYRKIPVLIQPMSYEDAVVKMVDTNLHREHISFSEKAFAYRMKNEAMKQKVGRKKGQSGQQKKGKKTIELIGEEFGDSPKQVQRYIAVRPLGMDTYEMISGHRRMHAAKLAGLEKIPTIIREMTDDEAVICMVDANVQREELLPSEKAFAYKMKLEAMKRRAGRPSQNNVSQNGTDFRSDELLAKQIGSSRNQIQRYIRLTELIPDLLELVDKKKLQFTVAVEISYIDEKIQQWLYEYIRDNGFIKLKQISALREHLKTEKINQQQMITLLNENMPGRKSVRKVTLSEDRLSKYFPPFYSQDDMEKVLIQLLEIWKQNQTQNDE